LAVACPYCLLTFEDAVKITGLEGKLQVLDVAELLALVI
jgi:Fe-S oxidoreductase